jgi:hypothetical protein
MWGRWHERVSCPLVRPQNSPLARSSFASAGARSRPPGQGNYSSSAIAERGGLDEFLHNLNVQAEANPEGFSATLSSQFHVSGTEVKVVLGGVHDPADAFMVLQLGQMSRQPTDAVMSVYQKHAAKGWARSPKSSASSRDHRSSTRSNGATSASAPRPPRTATMSPATDTERESTTASSRISSFFAWATPRRRCRLPASNGGSALKLDGDGERVAPQVLNPSGDSRLEQAMIGRKGTA